MEGNIVSVPDSPRLRFRLMDARDIQLWYELDQDPEVMRFLNDGRPTSWDELVQVFAPRIAAFTDPRAGHGLWEVRDKLTGDYLGWVLVRHYRFESAACETDNVELGWRLKRAAWGKGIASEAAGALVAELRRRHPALRVFSALADPANLASIGVMKKLGMRYVDERIHHTPLRDYPVAYYEMPAHPPAAGG